MGTARTSCGTIALAVAMLWHGAPAWAQESIDDDLPPVQLHDAQTDSEGQAGERAAPREVYTPEDFARFAPRNALDLIEEIPGFSVDDSDGGSRGFG